MSTNTRMSTFANNMKWAVVLLCALIVGCGDDTAEEDTDGDSTPLECERTAMTEFEECSYGTVGRDPEITEGVDDFCASPCNTVNSIYVEYTDWSDLSFATGLTTLEGQFVVDHNERLESLHGMDEVTEFGAGHSQITNNFNLQNLEGLGSLQRVSETFTIRYNGIESLEGLESLEEVEGILVIESNHNLTDLRALESLERVGEDLFIEDNEKLPQCEIDWLLERIEVGGDVHVTGNGAETDADCSDDGA